MKELEKVKNWDDERLEREKSVRWSRMLFWMERIKKLKEISGIVEISTETINYLRDRLKANAMLFDAIVKEQRRRKQEKNGGD